jgi:hypothetical protein
VKNSNSYVNAIEMLASEEIKTRAPNAIDLVAYEEFNKWYRNKQLVFSVPMMLRENEDYELPFGTIASRSPADLISSRYVFRLVKVLELYKDQKNMRFVVKYDQASELLWTYMSFPE